MKYVRNIVKAEVPYASGIRGKDIGIAILDSGISLHPDFENRIIGWYDVVNGNTRPYDDNGHGTHVAGIAAGSGQLSNGVWRGIATDSHIIAVKILDRHGEGVVSHIINGINWVIRNRFRYDIHIVNISVGTTDEKRFSENSELVKKVNELWDLGIVVIASAGNKGPKSYSISTGL